MKDDITWQFIYKNGKRARKDWKKDGGHWFYLKDDGYIAIDELIEYGKTFYYVDESGCLFYDGFCVTERGLMYFQKMGKLL